MAIVVLYEVLILRNNVGLHGTEEVTLILDFYGWHGLPSPLYSPDMSLWDFDLFLKLKEPGVQNIK